MPFFAPPLTEPPEPPPDPGDGGGLPGPPPPPVVTRSTIAITMADGTVFDLSGASWLLAPRGRLGFDAPTYETYADESPGAAGELYRGNRAMARDITLPVYLEAANRPEFLARRRAFLAKLPRGLNTLTVAETDGTRRSIDFYYVSGAEGAGLWSRVTTYTLLLRCPNPYWRGDPLEVVWAAPSTVDFYPILPLRVQSSQTFGATQFVNPGDVDSSGVWTIEGPTSGVTLTRTTAGVSTETLTLTSTMTAGQKRIIDTRPGRLSVVDAGGVNKFAEISPGTWPWKITPGQNLLDVAVGGYNASTKVTLVAEPLYETA